MRTHGTCATYKSGCRCEQCRGAVAAYQRAQVAKRRAAQKPAHVHGTQNGYVNYGCRCDECRASWAAIIKQQRKSRTTRPIPEHVHGTDNGYRNYRCRCRSCVDAGNARGLDYYHRKLSAAARGVPSRSDICKNNHDLTVGSEHVYLRRDGRKMCRTCNKDRNSARRAAA